SVMLIVSDAEAAVRWYAQALGAAVVWDLGGVARLDLEGAPFLLHEAVPGKSREPSPSEAGMTTTRIEVFVDEPDAFLERAAGSGGKPPPLISVRARDRAEHHNGVHIHGRVQPREGE